MSMLFVHRPAQRTTLWVLALWLWVLAASICAPLAQAHTVAQGMERLCSEHGAAQWVASPLAPVPQPAETAAHHLIDCPLCLPALAAPPAVWAWLAQALPDVPPAVAGAEDYLSQLGLWPPARAPPAFIA